MVLMDSRRLNENRQQRLKTFRLESKLGFTEYNVARGDDSVTLKIETPEDTVICWVPEEDTWCGSWTQLMCSSGGFFGKHRRPKTRR